MATTIESIKLPQQAKDQLIRLKRITGIEQWNILCRWAFCLSIAEKRNPPREHVPTDSSIEMTWRTFAGEHAAAYQVLLTIRAKEEDILEDKDEMANFLRAHIVRGIGYLTARRELNSIANLASIAIEGIHD
jgi:DNA sulfur modification protein DndE